MQQKESEWTENEQEKTAARYTFPLPKTGFEKIYSYEANGGESPDTMVKCPTPQRGQRVISIPVIFIIISTVDSFDFTIIFAPVSFLQSVNFFFFTAEARNP